MQQLHLVGFTTDHKGLILGTRRGSEEGSYVVALDRTFVEQIEELLRRQASESAEPGSSVAANGGGLLRRPKAESRLTPRQVQALLRTGRSVSEVAEEAGMSEDWIGRFAPPVLAEQARVVERAISLPYSKPRIGPSTQPLGESVIWNLAERGIVLSGQAVEDAWTAFQRPDGTWVVRVTYLAERRRQHADWSVDMAQSVVKALNKLGNELGYVEPGRRRPAALPPPAPVSASAQRAAAASPPRPPSPAPLPPRPSGRLSLLSPTSPSGRTGGSGSATPPRAAPPRPPQSSTVDRPRRSEAPTADRPRRRDAGGSDRPRHREDPSPDRPRAGAGAPGDKSGDEAKPSDRPKLRLPRDAEEAPDQPRARLGRDEESRRPDRPKVPGSPEADDPEPDGPKPDVGGDAEGQRPSRPKARLPRDFEEPRLDRPLRAEGERRPRPLRAEPDSSAPESAPAPMSESESESPGREGPDGAAGDARPLRRERPLRAPSRIKGDEPIGTPAMPARRPLVAPRSADSPTPRPPAPPRDPQAPSSGPEAHHSDRGAAPPEGPPMADGRARAGRASGPAVAEMEPVRPRVPRLPEVVANNHGTPLTEPEAVPRRPLRARRIVIDDLDDQDLSFAQPAELAAGDDPITAPVPAVDLEPEYDGEDPMAAFAAGELGAPHDQVLIRAGQAGTPDPQVVPSGPTNNGDERRGRRRLRRRGQDPS